MEKEFDIASYMTAGVERVVADSIKATLKNPKESAFMLKFAAASKKASKQRAKLEEEGVHVPPFLIASITSSCNLHCAGCYSRSNHATCDTAPVKQLSNEEWLNIFEEADELGVSFILLAGGEPLIRRDVIKEAAGRKNILFPVFTNGTYMDEDYLDLFDNNRNLIPVMSIEGSKEVTDARRGEGVYDKLISNMNALNDRGIIFGASVTVTRDNVHEVSSEKFLNSLYERGCKLVIYVEYVPVTDESKDLALTEIEQLYLKGEIARLRRDFEEMVFVSFPGDEKSSGGCIAAGRGFFHINSHGGAEPCPFSPYSDINVRDTSLKEAINSRLFKALQDGGVLADDHVGGCVLYEKKDMVEALLQQN